MNFRYIAFTISLVLLQALFEYVLTPIAFTELFKSFADDNRSFFDAFLEFELNYISLFFIFNKLVIVILPYLIVFYFVKKYWLKQNGYLFKLTIAHISLNLILTLIPTLFLNSPFEFLLYSFFISFLPVFILTRITFFTATSTINLK